MDGEARRDRRRAGDRVQGAKKGGPSQAWRIGRSCWTRTSSFAPCSACESVALLERYGRDLDFTAPDVAFREVEDYLPPILASRGLSPDPAMATCEQVSLIVQELPLPYYAGQEAAARARIAMRDPDDWPVLACALTRSCPIWTEDQDFFGVGVPTWTTDRIEIFLAASA